MPGEPDHDDYSRQQRRIAEELERGGMNDLVGDRGEFGAKGSR
jgi:hypothetical protein